jgi:uncharacterized protein (DUF1697 family)
MQSLSQLLESAGCEQVTTYIQSGNVVFKASVDSVEQFGEQIGLAIEHEHSFRPAVLEVWMYTKCSVTIMFALGQ